MRVLIVEDSSLQRAMYAKIVRHLGHDALECSDGRQAIALFESQPADASGIELILMDVEMPGLNGFATTRRIRELLGLHWIPIIFLSAQANDEKLAEGIRAGGDDYLYKPVNELVLGAKLGAMARIATMRDQLRRMNASLAQMAETDALTGLYNRGAFDRIATKLWADARRRGAPIAFVLIDIDHFKQYNDHYGHQAGDACLRSVSAALRGALERDADTVSRYGGEEFIMLLPGTDADGAMAVAERARSAVAALGIAHGYSPTADHVTISLGVRSTVADDDHPPEAMIQRADEALYRAKDQGRDRAVLA